jgi:hypothetical protein
MGELLQMQLTVAPPPLRTLRPDTPVTIEALINHMLAKDPAQRPQSAAEVLHRLNQILGQLQIEGVDRTAATAKLNDQSSGDELSQRVTAELLAIPSGTRPLIDAQSRVPVAADPPREAETIERARKAGKRTTALLASGAAVIVVMIAAVYGLYRVRTNEGQNLRAVSELRLNNGASPSPTQSNAANLQTTPAASPDATPAAASIVTAPADPSPSPTSDAGRQMQQNRKKAADHLQRARELYRQLEYQSALRECNASLKLNPQQPEARELQRKLNDAIRILNRR